MQQCWCYGTGGQGDQRWSVSLSRCDNTYLMTESYLSGYDVQVQTNHLSHFLLTKELFPLLAKAAASKGEARIVNHSSSARNVPSVPLQDKYFGKNGGNLGGNGNSMLFGGGRWQRYHQVLRAADAADSCCRASLPPPLNPSHPPPLPPSPSPAPPPPPPPPAAALGYAKLQRRVRARAGACSRAHELDCWPNVAPTGKFGRIAVQWSNSVEWPNV